MRTLVGGMIRVHGAAKRAAETKRFFGEIS